MAATVNSPKGGAPALLRMNLSACLKLQKVSGNSGYTSNTFIQVSAASRRSRRHHSVQRQSSP